MTPHCVAGNALTGPPRLVSLCMLDSRHPRLRGPGRFGNPGTGLAELRSYLLVFQLTSTGYTVECDVPQFFGENLMARPKSSFPTPAELEVLQILWVQGPSTVREVLEELPRERA